MPATEERMVILRMVEQGKISPEEGARLLGAMGIADSEPEIAREPALPYGSPQGAASERSSTQNGRQFRVRVTNGLTGKQKVSVNIPLSVVDVGLRFVPQNSKFDAQAIRNAIQNGMSGRIVDVMDDDKGDRVEIFIE